MTEEQKQMIEQYNALAERYRKAESYMDCYNLVDEALIGAVNERQQYVPDLINLTKEMDKLARKINKFLEIKESEYFGGIKI